MIQKSKTLDSAAVATQERLTRYRFGIGLLYMFSGFNKSQSARDSYLSINFCLCLLEIVLLVPQTPRASIPNVKEGSGIELTRRNSIGVAKSKLSLAPKILSKESMPFWKIVILEITLPAELVGQPLGELFPM
ncbi:hypothetical protein LC608_02750 [Nostoc sp. XA010]|nr:hypothetical protein [Nostoc sp. XA010]